MGNLKETAKAYEPKKTPVISELECVSLSVPISTMKGTDNSGVEFEYYVANVVGTDYRVPNSVMEQIQTLVEEKPEAMSIKVVRKGEGMASKYSVILLE